MDNRYYFHEYQDGFVIISSQEFQHLTKVRRCKVGDSIVAFNGDGYDYHLVIKEIKKDKAICSIIKKELNHAMQDRRITVYLAMIKNDALSTAIDNLAELNVSHVKLFKSANSVASIDENKLNKLKSYSIQASKQCERADIMYVSIIDKRQIKEDISVYKNRFFAYENSTQKITKFSGDFAVIIGPEGGFSSDEVEFFSSFAKNISLSKTILRAEVACVSAVSALKAVSYES